MEIHHQMVVDKQEDKQYSPPHEFTFTVSLHPSAAATSIPEKNKPPPSPPPHAAIDLSPADDIFFHGHLLPLHLLSHLSPRSSTTSLTDSFTLPITKEVSKISGGISHHHQESNLLERKARPEKPKLPFSLFGLPRWRKEDHHNQEHDHHRRKKKSKFDVSNVMQRYMRMIKPFLVSFRSKYRRSAGNINNNNNPHEQIIDHQRRHDELSSFSGNILKVRRIKKGLNMRGRRGEYSSAPATMRNSPANSGILVKGGGSGTLTPYNTCNKSDSTIEELHAAIQAAIAHCKNSISSTQDHIIETH